MDHVAIMKKEWRLTERILSGEKTIESRWYATRKAPWNRIGEGDIVYFKDSGTPIVARAQVGAVRQFDDISPGKAQGLLAEYGQRIGLSEEDIPAAIERYSNKKYCILVFLEDVRRVDPFCIDKRGYGLMSAWICIPDISTIRKPC